MWLLIEDDCVGPFESNPNCADVNWSLWNATSYFIGFNYSCCLSGEVGLQNGNCASSIQANPSTSIAALVCTFPIYNSVDESGYICYDYSILLTQTLGFQSRTQWSDFHDEYAKIDDQSTFSVDREAYHKRNEHHQLRNSVACINKWKAHSSFFQS
jgi:hypothetical protein